MASPQLSPSYASFTAITSAEQTGQRPEDLQLYVSEENDTHWVWTAAPHDVQDQPCQYSDANTQSLPADQTFNFDIDLSMPFVSTIHRLNGKVATRDG